MCECDKPTYSLEEIQAKVRIGHYRIAGVAFLGAEELEMSPQDIKDCVLGLQPSDFHKSMLATENRARERGLWQDVYRPTFLNEWVYIKLQVAEYGKAVVVQFKRK